MATVERDTTSATKNEEAGTSSQGGINAAINQANNRCTSNSTNIRRYLVLLQDCLAIKFVSIARLNEKRIQQVSSSSFVKSQSCNNFPSDCNLLTGHHCSCASDDVCIVSDGGVNNTSNKIVVGGISSGNSYHAAVTTSLAKHQFYDNGRRSEKKCDWKPSTHQGVKHMSLAEEAPGSSERGDHQECQFYRHEGGNQTSNIAHVDMSSSVKGGSSSKTSSNSVLLAACPAGDQSLIHQNLSMPNNKSNKSGPTANNHDKGSEYDIGGCCRCSSNNNGCGAGTDWESDHHAKRNHHHQNHLHGAHNMGYHDHHQKSHQADPTHHYNYLPQPNEVLIMNDAQGTSRDDGVCSANSNDHICRVATTTLFSTGGGGSSLFAKMDHSMQALFLYKEFREINLHCFWNTAVHEAFKNLEYKGSVVPATIIVGSPIRKHIAVLKAAWSRKMLRSPSGYHIDFLGEIEELIADPIAKSHFVPLSDSLCWAIHELTSSGQVAFVDDIFVRLASAFPGMALPTKELIYQTLEKLTRERKVYQTAQGYFVVTPDTYRYIKSTEPLLIQATTQVATERGEAANFLRDQILLRQTLGSTSPESQDQDYLTPVNHNGGGGGVDRSGEKGKVEKENDSPTATPSQDPDTISLPYGTFRRYNSLRIKKGISSTTTGCLPRRTLSMRLPKSKSKNKPVIPNPGEDQVGKSGRVDMTDSFQNLNSSQPIPVNEQLLSRRRKHKSFLSRLLSFRGGRKSSGRKDNSGRGSGAVAANKTQLMIARNDKSSNMALISLNSRSNHDGAGNEENISGAVSPGGTLREATQCTANVASASTQTSFSIENLNGDLALLSLGAPTSKSSTLDREDSDSGRCTDSHSDADAEIAAALNRGSTPTMHDRRHHHHRLHNLPHPSDTRSRDGIGNTGHSSGSSGNVYEKIESDLGLKVDVEECDGRSPRSPSSQMSVSPSPSTFTQASPSCSRGCSSTNNRQHIHSRCHSSASSSGYSYRDFYNLYRRRYPSYQQSTPTSLDSSAASEMLNDSRFKPNQPMRYPPRSFERKQIFDEINRSSFREKRHHNRTCVDNHNLGKPATLSNNPNVSWSDYNNFRVGQRPDSSQSMINNENGGIKTAINGSLSATSSAATSTSNNGSNPGSTSTTTFTQTVKNSTNLELEFRLPLGNIISAAMEGSSGASNNGTIATNDTPCSTFTDTVVLAPSSDKLLKLGIDRERQVINSDGSHKQRMDERSSGEREESTSTTLSEVSTMVNDLFTIKSFVKTNPFSNQVSSIIEFKTGENSGGVINNTDITSANKNKSKVANYVIEAVSSKPFANGHTKFNRESEII